MPRSPWVNSSMLFAQPKPVKRKRKSKAPGLPEWMLQAAMMAEFDRLEADGWELSAAGDMNAGRRSFQEAKRCKAMGMKAGEPDIRLYGASGRILFIEVKTKTGRKSEAQDARHTRLAVLGHTVLVVAPDDEAHARLIARSIATKFCDPAGGLP